MIMGCAILLVLLQMMSSWLKGLLLHGILKTKLCSQY